MISNLSRSQPCLGLPIYTRYTKLLYGQRGGAETNETVVYM